MKKLAALAVIFTLIGSALTSCVAYRVDGVAGQTEIVSGEAIGAGSDLTAESADAGTADTAALITGMDTVAYPNPFAVAAYRNLTEDQKLAYDVLSVALIDILENGPVAGKVYPFGRRIEWVDFKLAYNLLEANFMAADDFILNLEYYDSMAPDGIGREFADSVSLFDDGYLDESYRDYLETVEAAKAVLARIEHDGTDVGRAFAIAKWLTDNVTYPPDYEERVEDMLGRAHTALTTGEAICAGYAGSYDLLCKMAGLETIYVRADGIPAGHAWNMIRLDGEWYHVDTTWMHPGEYMANFLMTDELCAAVGHNPWQYYWDQRANAYIAPKADSTELCPSYHGTCEETLEFFRTADMEILDMYGAFPYVCFSSESEAAAFCSHSGETILRADGKEYVLEIRQSTDTICTVSFYENMIR